MSGTGVRGISARVRGQDNPFGRPGFVAIFVGVVPLMAGAVLGSIGNRMVPLASWLIGISPVSMPVFAAGSLLSLPELPADVARAVPRAFHFWLLVGALVMLWLLGRLWAFRSTMAKSVLAAPADGR